MRAILALEDGFILEGVSFTGPIELTGGEVIFNTTMIGYQELITDPAYAGQMLCITYPLSWLLAAVVFYIAYLRGNWLRRQIQRCGLEPEAG